MAYGTFGLFFDDWIFNKIVNKYKIIKGINRKQKMIYYAVGILFFIICFPLMLYVAENYGLSIAFVCLAIYYIPGGLLACCARNNVSLSAFLNVVLNTKNKSKYIENDCVSSPTVRSK